MAKRAAKKAAGPKAGAGRKGTKKAKAGKPAKARRAGAAGRAAQAKPAKAKPAKARKRAAPKAAKAGGRRAAKQPAASQPPRPAHGAFMWNELMTRDDGGAVSFFERLLGWTHQDWPMGPGAIYRVMKNGETSIAGIMQMTAPQFPAEVPPHWLAYIAVRDVDAMFERAQELGGQGVHPPTDIPMVGRFCIVKDPTGAVVALMTPEGGVA